MTVDIEYGLMIVDDDPLSRNNVLNEIWYDANVFNILAIPIGNIQKSIKWIYWVDSANNEVISYINKIYEIFPVYKGSKIGFKFEIDATEVKDIIDKDVLLKYFLEYGNDAEVNLKLYPRLVNIIYQDGNRIPGYCRKCFGEYKQITIKKGIEIFSCKSCNHIYRRSMVDDGDFQILAGIYDVTGTKDQKKFTDMSDAVHWVQATCITYSLTGNNTWGTIRSERGVMMTFQDMIWTPQVFSNK